MPPKTRAEPLRESLPLGDDRIAKLVAALPFVGSTAAAGAASIFIPDPTLNQPTSLHAELAGSLEKVRQRLRP